MYNHFPDDEHWRKSYPVTPEDNTPYVDLNLVDLFSDPLFILNWDAGFEYKPAVYYDGDRLHYGRFSGANQPLKYQLEDRDLP